MDAESIFSPTKRGKRSICGGPTICQVDRAGFRSDAGPAETSVGYELPLKRAGAHLPASFTLVEYDCLSVEKSSPVVQMERRNRDIAK